MNNPNKFGYYYQGHNCNGVYIRESIEAKTLKKLEKMFNERLVRDPLVNLEYVFYSIGYHINKYDYKAYKVEKKLGNARAWFECQAKHDANWSHGRMR